MPIIMANTQRRPASLQLLTMSVVMSVVLIGQQVACCPTMCSCGQPDEELYFKKYYTACDDLGWLDVPNSVEHRTTDLSLAGNQLYTLSHVTMSKLTKVNALYLQNNKFTDIDDDTVNAISSLPSLYAIDLSDNPWDCSCTPAMKDFVTWLEKIRGPRPVGDKNKDPWVALINGHMTTCASPEGLAGKRLDKIKLGDICNN